MTSVRRFVSWVWPYLVLAALCLAVLFIWHDAAWADHECQGGGCGNEREENYEGAGCKYFCPTFDKSPVDLRDNNVTICMPFSVCGEKPSDGKP